MALAPLFYLVAYLVACFDVAVNEAKAIRRESVETSGGRHGCQRIRRSSSVLKFVTLSSPVRLVHDAMARD
jgi:hypothetical protein